MDVLQWNVNGYFKRLENIKLLISRLSPTCICLQETNFTSNYCASIKGYVHFFKNRLQCNRASGGVAIFIKPYTIPEIINVNTNLETIIIKIKYPFALTICNIYLPNSSALNISDLNNLISQLPSPFIIMGDFNSHHFYWGSAKCDTRGKSIAEWLDDHSDILLLNNGQPTHFNSNTGNTSNIDLTLASQNISSYFEWNALDDLYDSDHFPIFIKTSMSQNLQNNNICLPKKWKYDKADWLMFSELVNQNILELPSPLSMPDYPINYIIEKFTGIILQAANLSIPKTTGHIRKNNLPWWNDDCNVAIRATKKAFKLFKKYARNDPNSMYKIDYKKRELIIEDF